MKGFDFRMFAKGVLVFAVMLTMTGCFFKRNYLNGIGPKSHFAYPNSNVIPLGKAIGEATVTRLGMMPPMISAELKEEALLNAISQIPEADILVDYVMTSSATTVLFFQTLTIHVEGTAAKMTVGEQKLSKLQ